ncbi:MAG: response regulator [Bacteriovorax sp.]|nr:response regulator [Bacteriovorax sp.]
MSNILFLDDEEAILNTYRRMLRPLGVNGYFAKNSSDAQKIIDGNKIDLIISDYRLEQETGLDFLKIVREKNNEICLIIISGYAEETFIKNAMDLKIIQDYLIKPISLNDFRNVISKFLDQGVV